MNVCVFAKTFMSAQRKTNGGGCDVILFYDAGFWSAHFVIKDGSLKSAPSKIFYGDVGF